MGLLGTLRETLEASTQSADRGDVAEDDSEGAYWCHDCSVRIRDVEVEEEGDPDCPECGDGMAFERSAASTGCAC
jgi:Zn finger protein HypA/HybF involved in hydrogenase expression